MGSSSGKTVQCNTIVVKNVPVEDHLENCNYLPISLLFQIILVFPRIFFFKVLFGSDTRFADLQKLSTFHSIVQFQVHVCYGQCVSITKTFVVHLCKTKLSCIKHQKNWFSLANEVREIKQKLPNG